MLMKIILTDGVKERIVHVSNRDEAVSAATEYAKSQGVKPEAVEYDYCGYESEFCDSCEQVAPCAEFPAHPVTGDSGTVCGACCEARAGRD